MHSQLLLTSVSESINKPGKMYVETFLLRSESITEKAANPRKREVQLPPLRGHRQNVSS